MLQNICVAPGASECCPTSHRQAVAVQDPEVLWLEAHPALGQQGSGLLFKPLQGVGALDVSQDQVRE